MRTRGFALVTWLAVAGAIQVLAHATAPAADAAPAREGADVRWFGYNEDWSADPGRIDLVAKRGANALRAVLSWRVVERRPGELRWGRYDALYQRMLAHGARPLWVLADAPCWTWAQTRRHCREHGRIAHAPEPAYDLEWARFTHQVAERYPETVAIESWNEPNLRTFFKPEPDAQRAATLAAWANWAVDRVNPAIPVLFGGPSPTFSTVPGQEIAYEEFLRDAYAAVGPGHWDGLGLHPFPSMRKQAHYLRDIHEHLNNARAILRKADARRTPIWVTEIGLSTKGLRPYSRREQATGLRRIHRALARRRDPEVAAMIVHRLVDQPPGYGSPAEAGWGVVRRDGRPKPALCELARVRGQRCR